MSCEWEIRRLDSGDAILHEISYIARPIGILLFGADGKLKDYLRYNINSIIGHIGVVCNTIEPSAQKEIKASLLARENVLAVINGEESRNFQYLGRFIKKLRKLGARKIIGICVRNALSEAPTESCLGTNIQLQSSPLVVEKMDYLVIVTET